MLDDMKHKDLLQSCFLYPTLEQVCYVMLGCRLSPAFLFRPA